MTEPAENTPVPPEPAAQPQLTHSGLYTLWETPGGGRLVVFKRLHTRDPETGLIVDIHAPKDERLPHVPPEALPLVSMWLDNGFPPAILNMLQAGKVNPAALLGQIKAMAGGLAQPAAGPGSGGADGAT